MGSADTGSLLASFRVLDLTDEQGCFCGKILGDMGAEVFKIERPGGDPARNIGPFYHDIPDPEKSLNWFAYNNNKKSITLNIEHTTGQEILKRLVRTADFIIESFEPGYLTKLGLDYAALSSINPRIIMTSITPFGQTGPYKDYRASDLTLMAMSGFMYMCGDPDRPPVRISFPQAYSHAGAQGAAGAMIAHYHRQAAGEGQHVDVSILECLVPLTLQARLHWEVNKVQTQREGSYRKLGEVTTKYRMLWPCKDGYICFVIFGGMEGAKSNRALVDWLSSEGMEVDFLKEIHWETLDTPKITQELFDEFEKCFSQFFLRYTKAELFAGALQRKLQLYPVNSIEDIRKDPQLIARKFWVQVQHPQLGADITYPGSFAILSETPLNIRYPAPFIGEHNEEIYEQELDFSREELALLKRWGVV